MNAMQIPTEKQEDVLTVTYPAQALRAAALVYPKNHIRFYLNGIFLNTNGDVVATDGHVLYRAKTTVALPGRARLVLHSRIPAKAEHCEISFYSEGDVIIRCKDHLLKTLSVVAASIGDGAEQYPNYERVIPKNHEKEDINRAAFTIDYLSKIKRIFKSRIVAIDFYGKENPVVCKPSNAINDLSEEFVIMQCRQC